MFVSRIGRFLSLLLFSALLSACNSANITVTAQPTAMPPATATSISTATPIPTAMVTLLPVATLAPSVLTFAIDPTQSIIHYYGTGAFNLQFPGTFGISGQTISFVPEGTGYRLNLNLIIDGKSVTAVNGLVYNALYNNMEINKFPTAQLTATSKEIVSLAAVDTQPITLTASGTLNLHGQSHIIDISLTFTIKDAKLQGTGAIPSLDLLDYGVNVPTAIFNSKLTLKANVVALQVANVTPPLPN